MRQQMHGLIVTAPKNHFGGGALGIQRRLERTFVGMTVAQGGSSLHRRPLQMSEAGGGKVALFYNYPQKI